MNLSLFQDQLFISLYSVILSNFTFVDMISVTSACNSLERSLGFQTETEAGLQWWKRRILATTAGVSDKGAGSSA